MSFNQKKTEKLVSDLEKFFYSDDTSIALSDGLIVDSYQKFAKKELTKTGKQWLSTNFYNQGDIVTDDNFVYVAKQDTNENINNLAHWSKIKTADSKIGRGLAGFVAFDMSVNMIMQSQNVQSVLVVSDDELHVIVDDNIRAGANTPLIFGFSFEAINIDDSLIQVNLIHNKDYAVVGKCIENNDNTLKIKINIHEIKYKPIINIMFL